MLTPRQARVFYIGSAIFAVFAVTMIYLELRPPPKELKHYRQLPPFQLTSQDGQSVTLADFKGKVWLADFVYTTCPGPCPIITAHLARLQQSLPADPSLRFASISTDPESDTPAVLKKYAEKYHASDRWTFLTGPKDQVYSLIQKGFMLAIEKPAGAPILHSTKLMLVDKSGVIRNFYDGATSEADPEIKEDIALLLRE